jgi:hypothetical protein
MASSTESPSVRWPGLLSPPSACLLSLMYARMKRINPSMCSRARVFSLPSPSPLLDAPQPRSSASHSFLRCSTITSCFLISRSTTSSRPYRSNTSDRRMTRSALSSYSTVTCSCSRNRMGSSTSSATLPACGRPGGVSACEKDENTTCVKLWLRHRTSLGPQLNEPTWISPPGASQRLLA